MTQTKLALRQVLRRARLSIPEEDRQAKSAAIVASLTNAINWSEVGAIHCYEPLEVMGEVDISGFTDGKQFFTSRLLDKKWQIVPINGDSEAPQAFDVVIIPMLGFDNQLHRIGYGGGYYDRLLAEHPKAQKIGVCFDNGKVEHIPNEPHDIAMDKIVTESAIY
ncbi:MAG: 5-formyltetrahydrofolate cyclo-ligase [Patescibacteria group bacterium]